MKTLCIPALVVLLTGVGVGAQDTPITIRAGRLLDGVGGVLENVTITVEASRITRLDTLSGPVTYDLSDLTVMPGWIDTHVHLTFHFDADGRNHSDPDETPAQAILYAAENAYRTLMAGFTTVQSLGSPRDRDLREAIARGSLPGPRVLTSLRAVNAGTGTPDEIRTFVRRLDADGADVVKIFASASIREGGAQVMWVTSGGESAR
jgi:imidazolonepropionase-like amidohydrolase